MEYGKVFHNCLRLQFTADEMLGERIDLAVEHCVKYGFDNIALMINAEEFNLGHITLKEADGWISALEKAKAKFIAAGVSVSVNNWIEIGHVGRGRKLKEGQNFTLMTDANGVSGDFVVCPLDEEWRKYYVEYVAELVSRLKPDTFWVEDDFRLHNHPPLKGVGCFCDKHIALFNKKLGTSYTREEFVKKAFAKGGLNAERKAWLDGNAETMYDTLKIIVNAVKKANPTTAVGIMSSDPAVHCVEGRDWNKFTEILSCGGAKINRVHLPFYSETSGKDALFAFNRVSMAMRALNPDDTVIMPETEHGASSPYRKSARFLRFTLEAAMPLILSGMTYSLYGFTADGVRENFGYGEVVKYERPYQQAVLDLKLKFSDMRGVIVPIDGKAAYKKCYDSAIYDLFPKEYVDAAYLSALGAAYKYSQEKALKCETIFLSGSSVDYFTDEDLTNLFKNNKIILEGGCALKLKERGLLHLINAYDAELKAAESGYQTYHQCADGSIINGAKNLRASCRLAAGDFVKIDYRDGVRVHTYAHDQSTAILAPCIVEGENFTILPFVLTADTLTLFCELNAYFVLSAIKKYSQSYFIAGRQGVGTYAYKTNNGYVLMFVNGNVDTFEKTEFYARDNFKGIKIIRRDGAAEKADFTLEGDNKIIIDEPLEYLSTTVLVGEL